MSAWMTGPDRRSRPFANERQRLELGMEALWTTSPKRLLMHIERIGIFSKGRGQPVVGRWTQRRSLTMNGWPSTHENCPQMHRRKRPPYGRRWGIVFPLSQEILRPGHLLRLISSPLKTARIQESEPQAGKPEPNFAQASRYE